jgi:cyclopropane fatty-acyl-phospholipid synthase-like methyltransferase
LKRLIQRVIRKVRTGLAGPMRKYRGAILPPQSITPCGRLTDSPEKFYNSAIREARRLIDEIGLTEKSRLLDVGSGSGRLAIGLLAVKAPLASYVGVDVDQSRVKWCKKYLTPQDSRFQFRFTDVQNARYNPAGRPLDDGPIEFADDQVDIIYLYSVFTHMTKPDVERYLNEFAKLLSKDGRMFITFFAEERNDDMVVNPADYGDLAWEGPLHCVLFSRSAVRRMLATAGFEVERIEERINEDGQSGWYIRRSRQA